MDDFWMLGAAATNNQTMPQRFLYDGEECRDDVDAVDAALDELEFELSTPCRNLLDAERRIVTCAEFTYECDILNFSLLRRGIVVVPKINDDGSSFICASHGSVALQANSDFFLGDVTFELHGPNGYYHSNVERTMPYSAFGKFTDYWSTNTRTFRHQRKLSPGTYTIEAYSQDAPDLGQTATFTVNDC